MIICCGEALIDMLPRRSTEDEPAFAPYSGGAVFNTAVALGRLGVPVEFFSGLSSDLFGQQLHAHRSPRARSARVTRTFRGGRPPLPSCTSSTGTRAMSSTMRERPAACSPPPISRRLEGNVDAMLFGAISLIPEPCGSAYEALMQREAPKRVTMLDPNIRPAFIPDREKHLARIQRMIAMADILKLSDEDLGWFGATGAPEDAIAHWLELGPKLVVMTRGSKGATGYTKDHKVTVTPKPVKVVDTVGAGDTFNAGILASLHEQGALSKVAYREPFGSGNPGCSDPRRSGCGSHRFPRGRQSALAA